MRHEVCAFAVAGTVIRRIAPVCCVLSASGDVSAADWAHALSYRYPIRIDGKWGYMDSEGRIVITPRFDFASHFSEGLALVYLEKNGASRTT